MAGFDVSTLKQPRWILAIVVALVLAAAFVRLGIWQLDRLNERRTLNAVIEERQGTEPSDFADLIARYGMDPEGLNHRQASVSGTYRDDLEFFSIGRTIDDITGTLVATPIELDDGSLMVVIRGLVPPDTGGPPAEGYLPPGGRVTVVGRLDDGEEPARIGEPEPDNGVLTSLSRVDLEFVDRWIDGTLLPVSLVLVDQDPATSAGKPVPIPAEELTEGSHLGYAIQWFAFAIIVVVGVAILIWRAQSHATDHLGSSSEVP